MREIFKLSFLCALFIVIPAIVNSQSVDLNVQFDSEQLRPGDILTATVYVDDEIDFYFISAEVDYHPDYLEFVQVENVGLSDDGLKVGDVIEPGKVGVSVTRTSDLTTDSSGDLMQLEFLVKQFTPAGTESLSFSNVSLKNSGGADIDFNSIPDEEYEVLETLSYAALTTPGVIEIEEGDEFMATAKIYANGVTQDELNSSSVSTWVGVSEDNSDPSSWDESVWEEMDFSSESDGYFEFESEIAYRRPLGNYYVAIRSELDVEGVSKYGGINGNWDSTNNPNAEMIISEQSPFRYRLVEWNFDTESNQPSHSLPQNDDATIEIIGAEMNGFISGSSGLAQNSNSWHVETEEGGEEPIEKYWLVTLSTENLEEILLSSKQYSSGTGPKDFKLQVSLDSENWTDVPGGEIEVGTNWTTGVLDKISLPESVDNQSEVFIRWLLNSPTSVDEPDSISASGTHRMDDIIITGINPNSERVEVWPGDADNDGLVNETDVLALSSNWYLQGPEAVYDYVTWEERPVEAWIPEEATYADANGDGLVNQNDLFPIGLNFGESRSESKQEFKTLSSLPVEKLKAGEELEFYILSKNDTELTGFSFNIWLDGVPEDEWQLRSVEPLNWADEWNAQRKLLDFKTKHEENMSGAFSYRGLTNAILTNQLVKIRIGAVSDWGNDPVLRLNRASTVNGRNVEPMEEAFISLDKEGDITQPISFIPENTELLPNYPNPFNPSTTIQYMLSDDSNVTVDIYNSIGRKVATLVDQEQQAGEYNVNFDASRFSSGIYFYRLQTNAYVRTRSMVLIK